MDTPICDFVRRYAESAPLRLHMPGHKGLGETEKLDITEIEGADVLYHARDIIKKSQENAAALFGTAKTLYSAEGSSLCIRAMLCLFSAYAKKQGRRPFLAAARNAHQTFVTACALLDIDVLWLSLPEEGLLSCRLSPSRLEEQLCLMEEKPLALYLTSPDYLGQMADIAGLSQVCRRHGLLLLVDNAHGAYLRFLPVSRHPMDLGADLCCDSAHKTLSVLTGGAYLHISHQAPPLFMDQAEQAMSLFASTSPSYLILQSLDRMNLELEKAFPSALAAFLPHVETLKTKLLKRGFCPVGEEPLKLSLAPKACGYEGRELARLLAVQNIICEFSDPDYAVFMLSPKQGQESLNMLENVLLSIEKRPPICSLPPKIPKAEPVLPPKEALFSPSYELPAEQCLGKILAAPGVICPPAVPVLLCGERIHEDALECLRYYDIQSCRVLY